MLQQEPNNLFGLELLNLRKDLEKEVLPLLL
jgi:hypothetical protein